MRSLSSLRSSLRLAWSRLPLAPSHTHAAPADRSLALLPRPALLSLEPSPIDQHERPTPNTRLQATTTNFAQALSLSLQCRPDPLRLVTPSQTHRDPSSTKPASAPPRKPPTRPLARLAPRSAPTQVSLGRLDSPPQSTSPLSKAGPSHVESTSSAFSSRVRVLLRVVAGRLPSQPVFFPPCSASLRFFVCLLRAPAPSSRSLLVWPSLERPSSDSSFSPVPLVPRSKPPRTSPSQPAPRLTQTPDTVPRTTAA